MWCGFFAPGIEIAMPGVEGADRRIGSVNLSNLKLDLILRNRIKLLVFKLGASSLPDGQPRQLIKA